MKKPRIAVENLAIELTRKCNLKCNHCMRGNAENKEMSNETLDRIFEEISTIGFKIFSVKLLFANNLNLNSKPCEHMKS